MRSLRRFAAALLLAACVPAAAQGIESVIMPGKVIEGHAKLESKCENCHVRFDKTAQTRLCGECHKAVAADVQAKTGYHGRAPEVPGKECRACHTDHKGREARVAAIDAGRFDHARTDFALKGGHAKPGLECKACHAAGKRWREAPGQCVECHRKDDTHKGSLGSKCADCHNEKSWKEAAFDHDKTRFTLVGKHVDAKCAACHEKGYKDTPRECVSCHRKDDTHKGRYGPKCETCHDARNWDNHFPHDTKTKFPLGGKHRLAKCDSCHKAPLYKEPLPTKCIGCHRADDVHKGAQGEACERCHNDRSWKGSTFDHDKGTKFPLRFKHREAKCEACHKAGLKAKLEKTCFACHKTDDTHKGGFGEKCESCHADKSWKTIAFDHERDAAYELEGKHAQVKCDACHKANPYVEPTPVRCEACHGGEKDPHQGQQGKLCEQCHDAKSWTKTTFNHARSRFPLAGSHVKVACDSCHKSKRYKDAPSECRACHEKEDVHKRTLGPRCQDCHNVRTWKSWDYDHAKRARYPLEGGHRKVPCASCHTRPADAKVETSTSCFACHRGDDVHGGGFGTSCERCHEVSSWRTIRAGAGLPPAKPRPGD
ncbi:MAG: cytochrome C [Betaproteobacteria bacterium]|nr:cytochrome C [Betaproteobacteria bacterium]